MTSTTIFCLEVYQLLQLLLDTVSFDYCVLLSLRLVYPLHMFGGSGEKDRGKSALNTCTGGSTGGVELEREVRTLGPR